MEAKRVALTKDGFGLMLTEDEAQALANAISKVETAMGFDIPHVLREVQNSLEEKKIYRNDW